MATTSTRPGPSPTTRDVAPGEAPARGPLLRAFDAAYRFLASVKLAVFSLSALAAVLGYATFFESTYGTHAVQDWIYRSKGFALLLAFLGVNVLCAATIRFRWDETQKGWKKRQTGFVITHAGLLLVLIGSYLSVCYSDEGHLMLAEGETGSSVVRIDDASILIQRLDPKTGKPEGGEVPLAFHPGAFDWDSRENAIRFARFPRVLGVPITFNGKALVALGALIVALTCLALATVIKDRRATDRRVAVWAGQAAAIVAIVFAAFYFGYPTGVARRDVLTRPGDPFQLTVKDYIAASSPPIGVVDPDRPGPPKIKVALQVQPPAMAAPIDVFRDDDMGRWLQARPGDFNFFRQVEERGSAKVVFNYVDEDEKLDGFLHPPADPLSTSRARFYYRDGAGKDRVFDWVVDPAQANKSVILPDSDLSATFVEQREFRGEDDPLYLAQFSVRKGGGPEVRHVGWGSLPMTSNVINLDGRAKAEAPLVRIDYYHPPEISREAMGRSAGRIEVIASRSGKMYVRGFNRHGLTGPTPLKIGQPSAPFGPDSPMKARFAVDAFYPAGALEKTYAAMVMPKAQLDAGLPAALVEMKAGGATREFWLRRQEDIDRPAWQTLAFGDDVYRVSFDFDRQPMGFGVTLKKAFQDNDPGTRQAANFTSFVTVDDPGRGVSDKAATITMNQPLDHGGRTFYQSRFMPILDDRGRPTGENKSVFQVGVDPYGWVKYLGCITVVAGSFVQFYMRPGAPKGEPRQRPRVAPVEDY